MGEKRLTISRGKSAYGDAGRTGSTMDQVTDVSQAAQAMGCMSRTGEKEVLWKDSPVTLLSPVLLFLRRRCSSRQAQGRPGDSIPVPHFSPQGDAVPCLLSTAPKYVTVHVARPVSVCSQASRPQCINVDEVSLTTQPIPLVPVLRQQSACPHSADNDNPSSS